MRVDDIMSLQVDAREEAITRAVANLYDFAVDGELLGLEVYVGDDQLQEYLHYPEDYEIGDMILGFDGSVSEDRAAEINDGAELTTNEVASLREAIANREIEMNDAGVGIHLSILNCEDGELFVLFRSTSMGQGGVEVEYSDCFKTLEDAIAFIHADRDSERNFFIGTV